MFVYDNHNDSLLSWLDWPGLTLFWNTSFFAVFVFILRSNFVVCIVHITDTCATSPSTLSPFFDETTSTITCLGSNF
jgi:hypothetical protein